MIRLRLLGGLDLTGSDGSQILSVLSQPKRVALLAYLMSAHPRGFHTRDKLLPLFWPEADDEHARSSLRQALHFLRRSLGDESILSRGEEVSANYGIVSCDVVDFEEAMEEGNLEAASGLYRGAFLEGFHLSGGSSFEDWLGRERERLRTAAVQVEETLSNRLEAQGDPGGALEAIRRAAVWAPANGRVARRHVELLAASGNRAGALRAFESFSARLREDYGLEPPEELVAAVDQLRFGKRPWRGKARVKEKRGWPKQVRRGASPSESPGSGPSTDSSGDGPRFSLLPLGKTARALAGVAVLALGGFGTFHIMTECSVDDPDIPVLLLELESTAPDAPTHEFAERLLQEIRNRLESQSSRVRPVGQDRAFDFLLAGTADPDSIRISLEGLDLDSDPLLELRFTVPDPADPAALVRLAAGIARRIEESVLEFAAMPPPRRGTPSVSAYRAYTQGRALWDLRDPRYFETAISRFGDAVAEDPEFALAWAALADAYNLLGAYDYGLLPPDSARLLARVAADRAMALDGNLAQAQAALATTHFFYEWDLRTAETLYESALRLDERYAQAHHYLALLLAVEGRFQEAVERIDQAILVQPSPVLLSARARIFYFAERFSEAREGYEEALRMDPHHVPALLGLGLSSLMDGDPVAAMHAYSRADEQLGGNGLVVFALMGHLLGGQGNATEARSILQRLEQVQEGGRFVPAEYFTMVHLGLGESDRALEYLYQAFEDRSNSMTILEVDPLTRPIREDPRFKELVARVWGERIP